MTLHMLKLTPDLPRLIRWAERRKLLDPHHTDDLGYALHTALTEAFGTFAPRPFAVVTQPGRQAELLGYTPHDGAALRDHAQTFADPEIAEAIGLASLATKPMPDIFPAGRRLGFTLRARPTIRTDRSTGGVADRTKIAERDAFREPIADPPEPGPSRGEVYQAWLTNRLAAGGVTVERLILAAYRRSFTLRRDRSRSLRAIDGPDASFGGVLIVREPEHFAQLLARGVGRHAAFGYGMLLLRPA